MDVKKCRGHIQANREFEIFPFIPHSLYPSLSPSTSFIGGFYPALDIVRLGMTLDPKWNAYHLKVWWLWRFDYLWWKHQSNRTWRKVSYLHPISRSGEDTENPSRSTILLSVQVRWRVQESLRRIICAISVSVQHQPPYYLIILFYVFWFFNCYQRIKFLWKKL